MQLRLLRPSDDMVGLTQMIHRAYAPLADKGLRYWGTHQTVEDTIRRCGLGQTWVLEHEGRVVGTGVLSFPTNASSDAPEIYRRAGVAKFNQLCVEPELQGRGASRLLLDHFETTAAELGATELACDTSEAAGGLIAMYERRGYRFVGHADYRPHVNYRSVLLSRRSDGVQYPQPLKSERLLLRPVGIRDAAAIQKHFDNWNIVRHMSTSVPWPYPADGARRYLEDLVLPAHESRLEAHWAICLRGQPEQRASPPLIGMIGYRMSKPPGDRMFWLAEPFWGQGLMTEAVAATQDHLFFDLGVHSIRVATAVDNIASQQVKLKTGAVRTGPTQCAHHGGGDAAEEWIITRGSWANLRNR